VKCDYTIDSYVIDSPAITPMLWSYFFSVG
jgi:hypothetical protein